MRIFQIFKDTLALMLLAVVFGGLISFAAIIVGSLLTGRLLF